VPARLINIKYITIRAEKVASPVTALQSLSETFIRRCLFNSSSGSCHDSDATWQEIGRTCGSACSSLVPVQRKMPRYVNLGSLVPFRFSSSSCSRDK